MGRAVACRRNCRASQAPFAATRSRHWSVPLSRPRLMDSWTIPLAVLLTCRSGFLGRGGWAATLRGLVPNGGLFFHRRGHDHHHRGWRPRDAILITRTSPRICAAQGKPWSRRDRESVAASEFRGPISGGTGLGLRLRPWLPMVIAQRAAGGGQPGRLRSGNQRHVGGNDSRWVVAALMMVPVFSGTVQRMGLGAIREGGRDKQKTRAYGPDAGTSKCTDGRAIALKPDSTSSRCGGRVDRARRAWRVGGMLAGGPALLWRATPHPTSPPNGEGGGAPPMSALRLGARPKGRSAQTGPAGLDRDRARAGRHPISRPSFPRGACFGAEIHATSCRTRGWDLARPGPHTSLPHVDGSVILRWPSELLRPARSNPSGQWRDTVPAISRRAGRTKKTAAGRNQHRLPGLYFSMSSSVPPSGGSAKPENLPAERAAAAAGLVDGEPIA